MKKLFYITTLFVFIFGKSQITNINDGESLTLRIHYGFLTAGSANLTAKKTNYKVVIHNIIIYLIKSI